MEPELLIKYLYCGKMGEFRIKENDISFVPDSAQKYTKLPHFFLVNPFDIANLFHEHNKWPFHKTILSIRNRIDEFTEFSRDKIGKRTSAYTTQSGQLNSNSSLRNPHIQVHPSHAHETPPDLKEIYDGLWFPLSP